MGDDVPSGSQVPPAPTHTRLRQLWGTALAGVARLPVMLTGAWEAGRWQGVLTAPEPIVALAAVASPDQFSWAKSSAAALAVPLAVLLLQSEVLHVYVSVGLSHDTFGRTRVPPSLPALRLPEATRLETGTFMQVAVVEGDPPLGLGVLVLARRDVQFVRKHIWRLRRGLPPAADEALAWLLRYRRHGLIHFAAEG